MGGRKGLLKLPMFMVFYKCKIDLNERIIKKQDGKGCCLEWH